ncbi:uncharacterized protein LOC117225058 [Megalopta genalis]|uniref:uncharacterized protein LOC117225058 n=1 Tax=Megalopta genalis TaxID=115081 RepID=UPI003FD31A21
MPSYKDDLVYKIRNKIEMERKHNKNGSLETYSDDKTESSVSESQDFCLQMSQSSIVPDTQDVVVNVYNTEVIVISDSSSNGSSPKHSTDSQAKSTKRYTPKHKVCIESSSNSECSDNQEEHMFELWRSNKKFDFFDNNKKGSTCAKKNSILFTSDDSASNNSDLNDKFIRSSAKTKSTYISFTPESNKKVASQHNAQVHINTAQEKNLLSHHVGDSTGKSIDKPQKALSSTERIESKKKLTSKDMKSIMKTIKATKVVYESPRRNNNVIIDESIDNDLHPAFQNNFKENTKIIDETPTTSNSDIPQDSKTNSDNLYKNLPNEISNTPNVDRNIDTPSELSERKKKQISEWLMTNSPDSISDSSMSIVPASNKNDVSSGNSSLERLEMNYETPNNRERIHKARTSEKRVTNAEDNKIVQNSIPIKIVQNSKPKQSTILDYTKRSKNNVLELRTPTIKHTTNEISTPAINKLQNINVMDCAEILDKLYGTSWRQKADELLPKSEPRKQAVVTKNRAVQTERKQRTRRIICSSESEDEDSSASPEELRPHKPSTKRNGRIGIKQKDSFINDDISSESGCESSYYTALTNPRTSTNISQPKLTTQPHVKRALRICDTDDDDKDENEGNNRNDIQDLKQKKLYFSEDESESDSSSTSEFDPGDDVPPKPAIRKDLIKLPRQTVKKTTIIKSASDNRKCERKHSFLASLSENVLLANVHPDAKKYRTDFKTNKESLCNYLYKLYNEKVFDEQLPKDMSIEWNVRMRGTAGFCYNKKSIKTLGNVERSSRIVLSTKVIDTPDRLRDTLIHEMCHAAAWLINNVSDGHGPYWTGWAKKAMKTFPDLPPIRRCHDYKVATKFTYKCVGCGYSIGRHSKSLDVERKRCGHCFGKFELLINKTTKSGTVQVQTPKRELNGFALFVKENYNSVKKDRNVKHAEIMKILGQQFSAIKIAKNQGNFEIESDLAGLS